MQISEQWLRSYVNPNWSSDELAERLTMAGLEVESTEPAAPPFTGVVVGQVLSVERHPNADKLTVCSVDVGQANKLSIVCGAPNVAAGIRVPCALVGAVLPGNFQIKTAKMRGVESQGMLCSARELGLSEDHGGLLILADDTPVGRDIRDVLALDDRKLTIKLTPNRGDCLSVVGIGREVAALSGATLTLPACITVPVTSNERLPVKVLAPDLCGRFAGRVLRGLNAKAQTPDWIKQRLLRSGQRPISALVDISNYVMLELGRPSHVFDLDRIKGSLEVRWGRHGESLELLNGQTIVLDEQVGVIADQQGVESLAGIMGGQATAVSLETTNIYLEAAFWWPEAIQGRARRFNFSTDAGHRFERGVDFSNLLAHIDYITRLIVDICGTAHTAVGPIDDQVLRLPTRTPVQMRTERCRKVLGIELSDTDIATVFKRLAFRFEQQNATFIVTPPSHRFDLSIEEDFIEEVARIHGFERIPVRPPVAPAAMRNSRESLRGPHQLRVQLAEAGYQEITSFSFVERTWEQDFAANDRPIKVLNPIAEQLSVMRSTLLGSLVSTLCYNINRKAARVRLFEIGRVFLTDPSVHEGPLQVAGINQPLRVGLLAYGSAFDEQWATSKRDVDFFDVKGELERLAGRVKLSFVPDQHPALHPGRSARVELEGQAVGWAGELHPRLQQKYELPRTAVVAELDLHALQAQPLPKLEAVPRFPIVQRDLALWFPEEISFAQIEQAISVLRATDSRLTSVREFRLFDLYRPSIGASRKEQEAGTNTLLIKEKSLAFRILLQDTQRTLSDADADAAVAVIVENLSAQLGARLRK